MFWGPPPSQHPSHSLSRHGPPPAPAPSESPEADEKTEQATQSLSSPARRPPGLQEARDSHPGRRARARGDSPHHPGPREAGRAGRGSVQGLGPSQSPVSGWGRIPPPRGEGGPRALVNAASTRIASPASGPHSCPAWQKGPVMTSQAGNEVISPGRRLHPDKGLIVMQMPVGRKGHPHPHLPAQSPGRSPPPTPRPRVWTRG